MNHPVYSQQDVENELKKTLSSIEKQIPILMFAQPGRNGAFSEAAVDLAKKIGIQNKKKEFENPFAADRLNENP